MNIKADRADLVLRTHEVIRLYDAMGTRLQCLQGELWVTQHRDHKDHFVARGDVLTLDRPGLAVIHAMVPAELVLSEPTQRPSQFGLTMRMLGAAVRASGKWIARRFGPEAIDDHRWRGGYGL